MPGPEDATSGDPIEPAPAAAEAETLPPPSDQGWLQMESIRGSGEPETAEKVIRARLNE